ncbi:hypothetical protein F5878DRAFT_561073 [Lentinula raphanica]|uniref:Uncharacterized protein n=1 Tax=Lentinula raphanica TaxID=153919 RepID=A0AA38PAZ2_9AGAR|nr:hypothetical protein F5878DRAFT_561073 [Lentinula raphanica]
MPPILKLICSWIYLAHISTTLLPLSLFTACAQEIRYIDDEFGDTVTGMIPIYTPSNLWNQGATCFLCGFVANPLRTFQDTWHDITHNPTDPPATVQFDFTGTTLDVYCIIPELSLTWTSNYNLSFMLDGQLIPQTFIQIEPGPLVAQYNVSVLSLSNLAPISHTFAMIAASTTDSLIVEFDYARYTFDDSGTTSNSVTPSPNINTQLSTSGTSVPGAESSSNPAMSISAVSSTSSTSTSSSATISPSSVPQFEATDNNNSKAALIAGTVVGTLIVVFMIILICVTYNRYKHRIRQRFFHPRTREQIHPFPLNCPPVLVQPAPASKRSSTWKGVNIVQLPPSKEVV